MKMNLGDEIHSLISGGKKGVPAKYSVYELELAAILNRFGIQSAYVKDCRWDSKRKRLIVRVKD